MTVRDILDRVAVLYNDVAYDRVSKEMYLKFLDSALSQIVLARPDCHLKYYTMTLVPGTKQTLPADALSLFDIYRNMGATGLVPGLPVWKVNRQDLDYFDNWHAAPGSAPTEIVEYAYEAKNAKTFWVSPPPAAGTTITVEMAYSYPFDLVSTTEWYAAQDLVLDLDSTYMNALVQYMLYLLYSTDSSSATDAATATKCLQTFYNDLGLEYKAQLVVMPLPGDTMPVQTAVTTGGK